MQWLVRMVLFHVIMLTEGCLLSSASGGTTALTLHLKEISIYGFARGRNYPACCACLWSQCRWVWCLKHKYHNPE